MDDTDTPPRLYAVMTDSPRSLSKQKLARV